MIQFSKTLLVLLAVFSFLPSFAEAGRGGRFLTVDGRKIYVEYEPAKAGQPTLVLLNGLTYSLKNWDEYASEFRKRAPNAGLLRFDLIGMGETLLKGPVPVTSPILYSDQVELTAHLMEQLGLKKAFIGGLSYGGGLAVAFGTAHPEMVDQLILMAPFTEPLKQMDQYIRSEVAANRLTFPLNPATDDELYDYFLRNFIYATYPSLEPSVLENPFKLEAIFRMIQGIRKYDTLKDARHLPDGSTHLVLADQDQYISKDVHDRFWRAVPRSARASRIDISYSEHKIPEAIPAFAAAWTAEILKRRKELNEGLAFQGNTREETARSGTLTIQLK